MIRPRAARWFEILSARDDATLVLSKLAATGAVELEARPVAALPEEFVEIAPLVAAFAELQSRYGAYWPRRPERASPFPERPVVAVGRALARIRAWTVEAEPLITRLQRIDAERHELRLWRSVVGSMRGNVDFASLAEPSLAIHRRLFVFPPDSRPVLPDSVLARRVYDGGALYALVIGGEEDVRALAQQCAAVNGRSYEAPAWLGRTATQTTRTIDARLAALDTEERALHVALDATHARHDLDTALGDAHRLQWVIRNVRALETRELFCWITGWTSDFAGVRLARAVDASGARALLRFAPPPRGMRAPLLLSNPPWVRPFEIFSRALGVPSRNEADPSALLAIAVPLMFGYMFGDIGQGALLAVGGFVLSRRFAIARLFVAGGLSAMAFGALFGSVFGMTDIIAPAWVEPLDDPLAILVVPLVGGAALLVVGLALAALEAFWRGETPRWLATDAAAAVAYVALAASFLAPDVAVVALAAALWFCVGHGVIARSAKAAILALPEVAERLFRLAINTLSFARVGAFALAHAGLASAIVALMDASDSRIARVLVLVVGNAVVIVLEAMVVSIQTTRLVLFEFFTRFLVAEGRLFRPLPPPSAFVQEN